MVGLELENVRLWRCRITEVPLHSVYHGPIAVVCWLALRTGKTEKSHVVTIVPFSRKYHGYNYILHSNWLRYNH